MIHAGGCHSPAISELPGKLKFKSQQQTYERVLVWQTPVKEGMAEIKIALENARKAMAESKASKERQAEAQVMINQAQEIFDAVTKDGSPGVHAPNYTRQRVDEAKLLAAVAGDVAAGKPAKKAALPP